MSGSNFTHIRSWLPVSGAVFMVILMTLMAVLQQFSDITALRYQSDWQSTGEWLRLLTGHVVHLGWMHLILNIVGALVIFTLFPAFATAKSLSISGLFLALGISGFFVLLEPQLKWYVGLSGVLHGWLILAAAYEWLVRKNERFIAVLAIVFCIAKVVYEMTNGDMFTGELIGGDVVYVAHVYGVICGLVASLFMALMYYVSRSKRLTKAKEQTEYRAKFPE